MSRKPAGMDRRQRIGGFTLLELLVVLAIIGLILSLTPIMLAGRGNDADISNVANRLVADLRSVRGEAVASNVPTSLIVDYGRDGYVLLPSRQRRQLPEGFRIALAPRAEADSEILSFYPDGTSTGGQLQIESTDDRYAIDVSWPTGRIRRGG